jgi:SAM-dependent methyltransferase
MIKRISPGRAERIIEAASSSPASDPRVRYPSWYLHRWHFLPEGYLSRRCAAGYEHIIRNVYNQGLEGGLLRSVTDRLEGLRPGALLEVGCGPGRLLESVAKRGFARELVGVDLSPYLLERARKRLRGRHVRLVHADGLALPSEDESFDAVVAAHYVGHMPAEVRAAAAVELVRVVRPGGHVVVVDHRWHDWPEVAGLRRDRAWRFNGGLVELTVFERVEARS